MISFFYTNILTKEGILFVCFCEVFVMDNTEVITEEELKIQKEWLFQEQIRIAEAREALNAEREAFRKEQREALYTLEQKRAFEQIQSNRLEMKKQLFQKKQEVLEREYRRLAMEKQQLEQEKLRFEEVKKYRRAGARHVTYIDSDILFSGVDSEAALKKRYRELLRIFHPDNMNGDTGAMQNINKEYDSLRRKYS